MSSPNPIPAVDDLEFQMATATLLTHSGKTPEIRKAAFALLQELHKQRTPQRVREMEEQQGLR